MFLGFSSLRIDLRTSFYHQFLKEKLPIPVDKLPKDAINPHYKSNEVVFPLSIPGKSSDLRCEAGKSDG
jgi:hypothetical protein